MRNTTTGQLRRLNCGPGVTRPEAIEVTKTIPRFSVAKAPGQHQWEKGPARSSLRLDDIHVMPAVAVGDEGDAFAIGRPRGEVVLARMAGQVALPAALAIHDVKLLCRLLLEKKKNIV